MYQAFLPPEITTPLFTNGPGAQPYLSASTAWTRISTEHTEATQAIASIASSIGMTWLGPTGTLATQALRSLAESAQNTAIYAQKTANAALSAANAATQVRATITPLTQIITNRSNYYAALALPDLIKWPVIAHLEAQYQTYWANNIQAILTYQTASSLAAQSLPKMPSSAQTTSQSASTTPAETGGILSLLPIQLVQLMPTELQGLLSQLSPSTMVSIAEFPIDIGEMMTAFASLLNSLNTAEALHQAQAKASITLPATALPNYNSTTSTKAEKATAEKAGVLSVPESWSKINPNYPTADHPQNPATVSLATQSPPGVNVIPAPVPLSLPTRASRIANTNRHTKQEPQYGMPPTFIPKTPAGG